MKIRSTVLVLALSALLSACDETDAVAVRIHVRPDFSGTLSASALARPPEGASAPLQTHGVSWKSQVDLRCASGDFAKLSEVGLSDATLTAGEGEGGLCFVRLSLPRGPEVHWAKELVPLDALERKQVSSALDASGTNAEVGSTVKFEITLPTEAIGNGVAPRPRGTKVKAESNLVTLIVPVETALTAGDPIVWHVTWQK
ncbi:MAG: hypothetical protein IPJ19_12675 [Planctomycetes bacterium]|nr:hypothetical protein [Planctomycetota bacterium]